MTDRAQREADERVWADMTDEPRRRDPGRCWLPSLSDSRRWCRGPKVAGRCTACGRPEVSVR
jgi:hypothetical protein